jgi:hypothetical protein
LNCLILFVFQTCWPSRQAWGRRLLRTLSSAKNSSRLLSLVTSTVLHYFFCIFLLPFARPKITLSFWFHLCYRCFVVCVKWSVPWSSIDFFSCCSLFVLTFLALISLVVCIPKLEVKCANKAISQFRLRA